LNWTDSPAADNGDGRRLAVLFQHYRLVPQLSALTNVLGGRLGEYPWWRTLWGFPSAETNRACEMLHSLGVPDGRCKLAARRLSGGEQQRVAVARALIQKPRILLADEPVASLDAETANQIMQLFSEWNRTRKLTVVCVLHDLEMAERYAARALVLDRGQLVYDGPSRNLQTIVRERLQWKTLL
jgi:phosphonate transport system ATP-binding protein